MQFIDTSFLNHRILEVPESCHGVARFTFEYLCGQPVLFVRKYEKTLILHNFLVSSGTNHGHRMEADFFVYLLRCS